MTPSPPMAPTQAPSRTHEERNRLMKVAGVDVHLIDEGPLDAPLTVILLSAQWLSAACFNRWATAIAALHRVIRIDLPGHGPTGPFADDDYGPQNYAALVDAVMQEIAPGPHVLVGQSFSGIAAAIHAATKPANLRGLVLATSSGMKRAADAPKPNQPPPDPAWADENSPRPRAFYDWKLGTLLSRPMDEAARSALLDEVMATNECPRRAREARLRVAQHDPEALSKALRQTKVPVLVQWSSDSTYLPPEMAKQIAATVPGPACIRLYPDTGHLLLVDAPEDCARDLVLFMETLFFMGKSK